MNEHEQLARANARWFDFSRANRAKLVQIALSLSLSLSLSFSLFFSCVRYIFDSAALLAIKASMEIEIMARRASDGISAATKSRRNRSHRSARRTAPPIALNVLPRPHPHPHPRPAFVRRLRARFPQLLSAEKKSRHPPSALPPAFCCMRMRVAPGLRRRIAIVAQMG